MATINVDAGSCTLDSLTRPRTDFSWPERCRTTRWSLVLAAASDGDAARAALSALFRAYFRPVFSFIERRWGRQAAFDLTQAFFLERFLEAGDLKRFERRPGQRFRGFLYVVLRNFLRSKRKYVRRQCRDVTKTESCSRDESADGSGSSLTLVATGYSPERHAARTEALSFLSEVIGRLRQEYCVHSASAGADGEARFEVLKVFLPGPELQDVEYAAAADALGLSTDAVKQIVKRLRARFRDLVNGALSPNARRALFEALEPPPESGA